MNYSNLMEAVNARIKANGKREITGDILNDVLRAMVVELGAGYQLGGTIRPGDKPRDEDLRVAYLAVEPGMYLYAGGFEVTELSLITYGAEWYMYPLGVPFGSQIAEDIAAAVEAEKTRAMAAEKVLSDAIATEASERAAADSSLDSAIKAETKRATDAEGVLTKAMEDEKARAMSAEAANAAAIASEADAREQADTSLQGNITAEKTAREAADTALGTRVTNIEDKIPAQASTENKLADKGFVNSSIATSTATFRGTFDTLEALKAAQADKNDYAFWVHKDEDGNTCYDKYTYTGTEWKFEYRLNNSSFTAAQWAALNSGVTADVIKALQDADKANAKAIADEKAARIAAISAEQQAREQADTANAEAITTETAERKAADTALQGNIDKKQDALVSGTNIKTINGASVLGAGDLKVSGGSSLVITLTTGSGTEEDPYKVDKSVEDVIEAINAKSLIYLLEPDANNLYPAIYLYFDLADVLIYFAVSWSDDNALWAFLLQTNTSGELVVTRYDFAYALVYNIASINGEFLVNGGEDIKVGEPPVILNYNGLGSNNEPIFVGEDGTALTRVQICALLNGVEANRVVLKNKSSSVMQTSSAKFLQSDANAFVIGFEGASAAGQIFDILYKWDTSGARVLRAELLYNPTA